MCRIQARVKLCKILQRESYTPSLKGKGCQIQTNVQGVLFVGITFQTMMLFKFTIRIKLGMSKWEFALLAFLLGLKSSTIIVQYIIELAHNTSRIIFIQNACNVKYN